jgi:hypothetical protein
VNRYITIAAAFNSFEQKLTSINGEKAIDSQLPGADRRLLAEVAVAVMVETHGCSGPESQKKEGKKRKREKKRKPLDGSTSADFVEEEEEKRQNKAAN